MRRSIWIFLLTLSLYAAAAMWWQRPQRPQDNRVQSPLWLGQWVTTWSGVTQQFQPTFFWGSLPTPPEFRDAVERGVLRDQTVRIVIQSTLSGSRIRIRLSNQYGKQPLTIGAARIVRLASKDPVWMGSFRWSYWEVPQGRGVQVGRPVYGGSPGARAAIAETDRAILFSKQTSVTIPAGAAIESDPVGIETGYRGYMMISLYLPKLTEPATLVSARGAYVMTGDKTALDGKQPQIGFPLRGSYWLADVEVFAATESKAILVIDDDGAIRDSSNEPNASWLEPFKERLLTKNGVREFAVLNSSIPYCALTQPCTATILQRMEDAHRNRPGVKWIILSAGYQDILTYNRPGMSGLSKENLINELKAITDAAHAAGLKIYGVTYPPFTRGWQSVHSPQDKEELREAVNTWIRESGEFDAVADFDQALRNPADPSQLQDAFTWPYQNASSVVLSDIAFRAMAETFDLSVF